MSTPAARSFRGSVGCGLGELTAHGVEVLEQRKLCPLGCRDTFPTMLWTSWAELAKQRDQE
jgi:hypothetical protein